MLRALISTVLLRRPIVLVGLLVFVAVLASLAIPQPAPSSELPGAAPAHPSALPALVAAELISALAAVALAGTVAGPPP